MLKLSTSEYYYVSCTGSGGGDKRIRKERQKLLKISQRTDNIFTVKVLRRTGKWRKISLYDVV
jgi:hypothetical protein